MATRLTKVTYIKSDGSEHPINIIEVAELNIVQDIFNPHISGELIITDRDFWQNVMPMLYDKIEITIEKPNLPKTKDEIYEKIESDYYTYVFDVYKSVQLPIDISRRPYRDVCVYFTAGNMVEAYTTPISKSFHNKTFKQIVGDLLRTINMPYKFNENYIEPLTYTSPMWTPIKTITDMCDYVISENNNAGVLFFQDMNGVLQFTTIPELFKGSMGEYKNTKTYIPSINKTITENHSLFSSNQNFNKIITMQFTRVPNYMKMANKGFFNSEFTYIDLENNKIDSVSRNITETKKTGPKLSKFLSVNNEMLGKYKTNETYISPCGDCSSYLIGQTNSKINKMLFDMYEIKIGLDGYIDRKLGQLIKIDVPSQLALNRDNEEYDTPDNVYTGTFLIRSITHRFTDATYGQEIVAVTDGINNDEHSSNNIIEW